MTSLVAVDLRSRFDLGDGVYVEYSTEYLVLETGILKCRSIATPRKVDVCSMINRLLQAP